MTNTTTVQLTADALTILRSDNRLTSKVGFDDPHARYFVTEAGKQIATTIIEKIENIYVEYNLARFKYFMDQIAEEEFEQLLILGSGYDTRSLWMEKFKSQSIAVFEVDYPEKLAGKTRRLQEAGIKKPAYLRQIGSDLANDQLPLLLVNQGFSKERKTMVVLEGVVFFLPANISEKLLDPAFLGLAKGTRFLFDFWTLARVAALNALSEKHLGKPLFGTFKSINSAQSAATYLQQAGYRQVRMQKLAEIVSNIYHQDFRSPWCEHWLVADLVL